MRVLARTDEVTRWEELRDYVWGSPLTRFWINFWRRRYGEAPFRLKEARVELEAQLASQRASPPP